MVFNVNWVPTRGWSSGLSLRDFLGDLPDAVKTRLARGFEVLIGLEAASRSKLQQAVIASFPEQPDISEEIGVTGEAAEHFAFSVSLLVGAVASPDQVAEDVVGKLNEAGIIPNERKQDILEFALQIQQAKPQLLESARRMSISRRILPAFENFSGMVDVRLQFTDRGEGKERIAIAVPVAILFIDTDVSQQRLIFQATSDQIDELVLELQKLSWRLRFAEKWLEEVRK